MKQIPPASRHRRIAPASTGTSGEKLTVFIALFFFEFKLGNLSSQPSRAKKSGLNTNEQEMC